MAQNREALRRKSPSDHGLAVLKVMLQAIPLGGSLASLVGDYLPTSWQRAFEKITDLLTERIASLEGRITEKVNEDDFSALFNSCIRIAADGLR